MKREIHYCIDGKYTEDKVAVKLALKQRLKVTKVVHIIDPLK